VIYPAIPKKSREYCEPAARFELVPVRKPSGVAIHRKHRFFRDDRDIEELSRSQDPPNLTQVFQMPQLKDELTLMPDSSDIREN
jgi:hypothetical protein